MKALIPIEVIEQRILLIRGQKVMLSTHLADLYNVGRQVREGHLRLNFCRVYFNCIGINSIIIGIIKFMIPLCSLLYI